jgi:hypothetical protein
MPRFIYDVLRELGYPEGDLSYAAGARFVMDLIERRKALYRWASGRRRPKRHPKYEPLYDVDPRTGATVEIFFADRVLADMRGAGWHWWNTQAGEVPEWPPHGPFSTSYGAYRDAMREYGGR